MNELISHQIRGDTEIRYIDCIVADSLRDFIDEISYHQHTSSFMECIP